MSPEPLDPAPVDSAAPLVPDAPPSPWWRRALPFAVAAALFGFAFRNVDPHALGQHLAAVNVPVFTAFAVVFLVLLLTADAFATAMVYRRVAPIPFGELWVLRGASYLPSLLNHHLGQAFLTYAIARRYSVPLARMAGGTLLVYASWVGLLLGASSLGMVVRGDSLRGPGLVVLVGVAYLAVIVARPARLARTKLLAPLFEAGLRGHLVALAVRLPHFVVLFAGTWVPFLFFGVDIPLGAALVRVPILMAGASLPITPMGVGTRDVLAAGLFEAYAPGATPAERLAAIFAATASWEAAFIVLEALLGLLLLRRALPAMERRPAARPEA
jgi:hypothetical protein